MDSGDTAIYGVAANSPLIDDQQYDSQVSGKGGIADNGATSGNVSSDEDTVYDSPTLITPTNESQERAQAAAPVADTAIATISTTKTEPGKETAAQLPNNLLKYLDSEIPEEEEEEEEKIAAIDKIEEHSSCAEDEDCFSALCDSALLQEQQLLPLQKITHTQRLAYIWTFVLNNRVSMTLLLLTVMSFVTRFYAIGRSRKVVWDEAHFGKFGSFYLRHQFYFDVHPPLGKMLVGLSGYLANYDGSFPFESGKEYPSNMNVTTMRAWCALWGALLVPLAFGTSQHLGFSLSGSALAALLILCDSALLTISRFILLDSMLLFFTALSFYCLAGLRQKTIYLKRNQQQQVLSSKAWWAWLLSLGVSLGCVLSVKWVGLFAVALTGLYTVHELWDMLGDVSMPKKVYASHWAARVLCLILVPVSIYVASFAVHFKLLHQSGPGDAHMSSLFQATLNGSVFSENPLEVAFGSNVTIKNFGYGGALLHSHQHVYPGGSKQQQVTCYGHKDQNNQWQFRFPREAKQQEEEALSHYYYNDDAEPTPLDKLQFVKHGDKIRLVHLPTLRNLHSHPIQAPLHSDQWEVSAYGSEKVGDVHDYWQVEIVDSVDGDKQQLKALTSRFRLRHVRLGCYLASKRAILPDWGYKQHEVFCDRRSKPTDKHTWWNIEEHQHTEMPAPAPNAYQSNFWEDFWRLNAAMWNTNNALVPDSDKNDLLTSSPMQWPLVTVGLRMCSWDSKNIKYYLIGTPAVWWSAAGAIACFALTFLVYHIQYQRQLSETASNTDTLRRGTKPTIDTAASTTTTTYDEKAPVVLPPFKDNNNIVQWWPEFKTAGCLIFGGWFLHYIPFYMMGRVTYLHHYFPALYFSVFMVPFMIEHAVKHYYYYYHHHSYSSHHLFNRSNSSINLQTLVYAVMTILVIANFIHFAPFSYGMTGEVKQYASRRWFERWNLIENLH